MEAFVVEPVEFYVACFPERIPALQEPGEDDGVSERQVITLLVGGKLCRIM